jgi:hypothetical protein
VRVETAVKCRLILRVEIPSLIFLANRLNVSSALGRSSADILSDASRAMAPSFFWKSRRSLLFPLALQDEGGPVIWLSPLLLFPDRQLSLT